ncbi:MAG: hypothetical protein OXT74_09785 [Candidatus Poribacteria bacterium]|nr:hypothetical protein [Candidatus Poribacteria bacterium]
MDDLIQLIPFIIIALTLLGRVFRRKKPQKSEPEVPLENEQEVTLPPWGNIETMDGNTGFPDFLEQDEPSSSPESAPSLAVEETQPPPDTPAPKPIEHPTLNQTEERRKVTPVSTAPTTIAGISLTPQTFRQGIILREILGPPKSLQRRRTESEN